MSVSSSHCSDINDLQLSSSEEEDLRLEQLLLKDKWRAIFDQFDPEGFGEIPWSEFLVVINQEEFKDQVSPGKRDQLIDLAYKYEIWCSAGQPVVMSLMFRYSSSTSAITFQQFVNVMSGKRTASFTCAVQWRDRGVRTRGNSSCLGPLNSMVSTEMLADPRDRKFHTDIYRCWPPPWCLVSVTLLQLCLFSYYSTQSSQSSWPERGDRGWADIRLDSLLVYSPRRKRELWRFLSYCLIHSSWWHLAFNVAVQLLLGVPLEMVHGSARVGLIYTSGVLAGSLSTSVLDPEVGLVGASGGVYSLLAGHLANLVINFHSQALGPVRLVATLAVASLEVEYSSGKLKLLKVNFSLKVLFHSDSLLFYLIRRILILILLKLK